MRHKRIWKMSGSGKERYSTRLYCYVECERMDDAFRIARATFGNVITSAQRLAIDEAQDETLPYFKEV